MTKSKAKGEKYSEIGFERKSGSSANASALECFLIFFEKDIRKHEKQRKENCWIALDSLREGILLRWNGELARNAKQRP